MLHRVWFYEFGHVDALKPQRPPRDSSCPIVVHTPPHPQATTSMLHVTTHGLCFTWTEPWALPCLSFSMSLRCSRCQVSQRLLLLLGAFQWAQSPSTCPFAVHPGRTLGLLPVFSCWNKAVVDAQIQALMHTLSSLFGKYLQADWPSRVTDTWSLSFLVFFDYWTFDSFEWHTKRADRSSSCCFRGSFRNHSQGTLLTEGRRSLQLLICEGQLGRSSKIP